MAVLEMKEQPEAEIVERRHPARVTQYDAPAGAGRCG
jgi:hypothetical protein